ncbi:MAG: heparan-alpha-glucosaminide N-acetyltransferase domain-containing protein [Bacteroidota bacterium]
MKRIDALDLLRGLIMILMAIDHASFFVGRVHYAENWGVDLIPYDGPEWFLTRFVSHLCAPGFFLLMGMGMIFFTESRLKAGWSLKKIRNFFLKRGLLLILLQFFLEGPAWIVGQITVAEGAMPVHLEPGTGTPGFFIMAVLFSLGMSMIIGALLLNIPTWALLFITLLGISVTTFAVTSRVDPHQPISFLESFFLLPGISPYSFCKYPVLPWLGITTAGMALSRLFLKDVKKAINFSFLIGIGLIIGFVLLRCFIPLTNFEEPSPSNWIDFLTVIKYPASPAYICLTIGVNLILLKLFTLIPEGRWQTPLLIFGKTAFFFYILHLYIYMLFGLSFPEGSGIGLMYLFWFLGLVLLFFACRKYLAFKKTKPIESVWRFF